MDTGIMAGPKNGVPPPRVPFNCLVVTNLAAPYRIALFEAVASAFEGFAVVFQVDGEPERNWDSRPETRFGAHYLRGVGIRVGRRTITLCKGIGSALRSLRPDVVVACGFSISTAQIAWYAASTGAKLVLMNDGIPSTDATSGLEFAYRRTLVRAASGFIASCGLAADYFRRLGAPDSDIHVVELTTDLRGIKAATADPERRTRSRSRLGLNGPTVGYVGRLVPDKRVEDLIEAFGSVRRRLPGAELLIAGDGPLRKRLESRAAQAGIEGVRFLGMLDWESIVELYSAIDVLAFPATRERFGMVVIEALAAGVPVVASEEAGATSDLVSDGENGFSIRARDVPMMTDRIMRLLESAELRATMSRNARGVVDRHDVRLEAERFVAAISGAIGKEVPASG